MADIITRSFHMNIAELRFVGLYDHRQHGILYRIRAYILYSLSFLVTTLLVVKLVVGENDNYDQWTRSLILLDSSVSCYLKFIAFMVNASRIKKCLHFFGEKQFAPKNKQEERIVEDCIQVCQRNFRIYFSLIVVLEFSWNLMPFFEEKQMFPLDIWLPCDLSSKPVLFYAIYWYCAAGIYTIRLK